MTFYQSILLTGVVCIMAACHTEEATEKEVPVHDSAASNPITEPTAQAPESKMKFETYCNSRFNYCIDYPSDLLIPQGEAGNGDGQAFTTANGHTTLLVYRDFRDNIDPDVTFTLEQAYRDDLKAYAKDGKTVSYKTSQKSFYVISGTYKDKVFYQKTILSQDGQPVTSLIEYKTSEKEIYNKVCERIFSSLK